MSNKSDIAEIVLEPEYHQEIIRAAENRFPEIERIIIFGSRALGTAKSGSDIDIAIDGDNVTRATRLMFYDWLNNESSIPYKVDVLQLRELSNADLITHIKEKGKIIFDKRS